MNSKTTTRVLSIDMGKKSWISFVKRISKPMMSILALCQCKEYSYYWDRLPIFYTTELDHPIPEQLFAAVAPGSGLCVSVEYVQKRQRKTAENSGEGLAYP